MKSLLFLTLFCGSFFLPQSSRAQASAEDQAAIMIVVKQFEDALRNKDTLKLKSLYFGKVVWVSVIHPESLKLLKTYNPQLKAIEHQGAFDMLSDPRMKNTQMEEVFGNPVIHSDGQLATAVFDYGFKLNGQFTNWGKESWHLVKDEGNWKIVHLIYSYNLVQVRPLPDWLKGK